MAPSMHAVDRPTSHAIPELHHAISARVSQVVGRAVETGRLVGAAVEVVLDGSTASRCIAGLADRPSQRGMSIDTLFRLASVSKPIVATAAMVRVSQGRLELDAPIDRWLPQFRPVLADGSRPEITLRQLLSHTAGLGYRFLEESAQGPHALAGVSDGMDAATWSLQENLRRIGTVALRYAPGQGWGYSLSIDVVGALLERCDGAPLQEIIADAVTGPLGMLDTAFHALDPSRLATAYVSDTPQPHPLAEGEVVTPFEGLIGIQYSPARAMDRHAFPSGGAGMVGSVSDVVRLLEALRCRSVPGLSADLVDEMGRIQPGSLTPENAPGSGFGLGFSVLRDPALAQSPESVGTWRWGGAYGHSWFVDPARRLTVVAMTNTLYEGMSGAFVTELRDAIYAGLDEVAA